MKEQEGQKCLTVEWWESHYRASHSKDMEVSWSLRQDGLEGVMIESGSGWEGGREGGAAVGLRPGVLTKGAST